MRRGFVYLSLFLTIPIALAWRSRKAFANARHKMQILPLAAALASVLGIMTAMYTVWFGFAYSVLFVIMVGIATSMMDALIIGPPKGRSAAGAMGHTVWRTAADARWRGESKCRADQSLWLIASLGKLASASRVSPGDFFRCDSWTHPNAIEHRALALSLLKHGVFYFRDFNYYGPSSVQSPPYPFLLATLFKIFGADSSGAYIAAMIVNSVFGAIAVWMTYLFVRVIGGRENVALISAALIAIWPSQVFAATAVQAIAMITCCVVAMFYFFQAGVETGKSSRNRGSPYSGRSDVSPP